MQDVLPFSRIAETAPYMDSKVLDYINEGQIETFESFPDFSIMSFDWYDVGSRSEDCPQILAYIDREDLFFFCEDSAAEEKVRSILSAETGEQELTNGQLLYRFFARLLKGDMSHLDQIETEITETENQMLSALQEGYLDKIVQFRKELLKLKQYYEQLDSIFDEAAANDNGVLDKQLTRRFTILSSRTDRYLNSVASLREYVAQLREAYQAQIDIQQNDLMKVFTVVTAIFLPLTLLVGWYGMNFSMPELHWRYGYPTVIAASVLLVVGLIVYFKKKKWF
jgi:magnesium transporter